MTTDLVIQKLLKVRGACPPEDVGGLGGYEEFIELWNAPEHTEHEAVCQWGEIQHYQEFEIDFRNDILKTCLKIKKVKQNIRGVYCYLRVSVSSLCQNTRGDSGKDISEGKSG